MHEREHAEGPAGHERAADRASAPAHEPRAAALLRMQASAGNRATARWLAREAAGPIEVKGPSRALLEGEVPDAASGMAAAASAPPLRNAPDEDGRTALMLSTLGIPAPAEGQTKPTPDEATKKAADAASGMAMAGATMGAQGMIENLLRGGGPRTQ